MPISSTTQTLNLVARAASVAKRFAKSGTLTPQDLASGSVPTFIPVGTARDTDGTSGDDYKPTDSAYNYLFRSYLKWDVPFSQTALNKQVISSAVINFTYDLYAANTSPTVTTNVTPVLGNTGTRTVRIHRTVNTFAASSTGGNYANIQDMMVVSPDRSWSGAMLEFVASPVVTIPLSGVIADNTAFSVDIMPLIQQIAPTWVETPLGMGLNTQPLATGGISSLTVVLKMESETTASSSNCAQFNTNPTLVMVSATNTPPSAPVLTAPENGVTLPTDVNVPFSGTFVDQTGDAPTKFDLVVSERANMSKPVVDIAVNDSVIPLDTLVPLSTFKPSTKFYWRMRAYDALGAQGAWSSINNFFTPSVTGWVPTTVEATQITPPRNKYRIEFYPLLPSLNGFDPNPSAIIFDAKAIGVAHTVNSPGEFFFTLTSDHPQIQNVIPQKTFWRASRWDERTGYYRIAGEGVITNSVITPHEVIFYGTDKIGMLNRVIVSADKIASGTSHTGTIESIHEQITRSNLTPLTALTLAAPSSNSVSITATAHPYKTGDSVMLSSFISGTHPVTGSYIKTVSSTSTNSITVPAFYDVTTSITAAVRNTPTTGQVTYTTATPHGWTTGARVTVTNASTSAYNFSNLPITVTNPTQFWVTLAPTSVSTLTATATLVITTANISPIKRPTDMGWGETPATLFSSYIITNSAYSTATTSKQVQIAGYRGADALAAVADILMAGTTNKVILENPNIGQPAEKIDEMEVGLQYRHLQVTDIVKPAWWFQYGVNIKDFTVEDNLDKMATKSIVINRNLDQGTSSLYNNGTADTTLYNEYGLIEQIEIINEERNDIEFSAQLQYNLNPDRLFTIQSDVIPNTVSPFANYAVGDDITVYIVHNRANIKKDLTIVGQRWIGNSNGAEYLMFMFAPRITQSFLNGKKNKDKGRGDGSGRGRGGDPDEEIIEVEEGRGRGGGGGGDWTGGDPDDSPIATPYDPVEPTEPGDIWYDGPWS